MSALVLIPAILISAAYLTLITAFVTGWFRTKKYHPGAGHPSTRVTILIPCKNEENNIQYLARHINNQDYPDELLQVIWINDHSADETEKLLNQIRKANPVHQVISMDGSGYGKKAALKAGMEAATGDLVLLTDADSRPGPHWISTMAGFQAENNLDLVLGPVVLDPADRAFQQIQKLEYLSLVASSIGAAGIHHPVMAQGPNMAVRASDYRTLVENLDNRFASGDDVFLLEAMMALPGKKIGYALNRDAIVSARPADSPVHFLRQRQRWASKATGYKNPFLILTTLLIFIENCTILAALILAATGSAPWSIPLILLGIKTLADLPLLMLAMRFFQSLNLLWWFLPVQLLYPFYIAFAGVLSQLLPVHWKPTNPTPDT